MSRGEKGIEIFSAARRQVASRQGDEPDRSWRDADRVAYVWDLSQTGGQPLPVPAVTPAPPGEVPPGLWDCLCWLARREGFAVERESGCPADGTTFWTGRRIRVLPGPGATIVATGERIITAANRISRHLDRHLPGGAASQVETAATITTHAASASPSGSDPKIKAILRDAEAFYVHFRDRVMLPVHDEHGNLAGFIGRAHPDSGPDVPKYLNTPETSAYKKGNLLFGLYQARPPSARRRARHRGRAI